MPDRHRPTVMRPFAVLLALGLTACASGPSLRSLSGPELPARVELAATPFFPQQDYQCGPAALATVLVASGVAVTAEELVPRVFLPGRQGSLQVELVAAARQYDRLAYLLAPELPQLIAEVAAGRPVLVMQNLGLESLPVWHFAVVIGYDRAADRLVLRSGTTERHVISTRRFLSTWERAGRWALLALPPGEFPVAPDPGRYLTAAAELEATGRLEAAASAYDAARSAWPESALPHVGRANIAYARGQYAAALAAFDEALLRDPRNIVAHHNRGEALQALGCTRAATLAMRRTLALAEGSPFAGAVRQTLEQLEARSGDPSPPAHCPAE